MVLLGSSFIAAISLAPAQPASKSRLFKAIGTPVMQETHPMLMLLFQIKKKNKNKNNTCPTSPVSSKTKQYTYTAANQTQPPGIVQSPQ